jgi:hypothetical protein
VWKITSFISTELAVNCEFEEYHSITYRRAWYELTLFAAQTGKVIASTRVRIDPEIMTKDDCPLSGLFYGNENHIEYVADFQPEVMVDFLRPYSGTGGP